MVLGLEIQKEIHIKRGVVPMKYGVIGVQPINALGKMVMDRMDYIANNMPKRFKD